MTAVTKDMRIILLGIASALYPFGQFIGSPLMEALADRHGRRPIFVSAGFALSAALILLKEYSLKYKEPMK